MTFSTFSENTIYFVKMFFLHLQDFAITCTDLPSILLYIFFVFLILKYEWFIHEHFHYLTIKKIAKKMKFQKNLTKEIIHTNWHNAYIYSNLFELLAIDTTQYSKEIKKIAKAGVLYSSILYFLLIILFILLMWFLHPYFFVLAVIFLFTFITVLLSYFLCYKEKYDDKGELISQPDRFLVKHPEQFKNIHK